LLTETPQAGAVPLQCFSSFGPGKQKRRNTCEQLFPLNNWI